MAPVRSSAVVDLRDEDIKVTEHMRRKSARAVKQRNRMAEVSPGCVDDAVAVALGTLASSETPLPRVEADGVEYLEPDYRSAKQKKRAKKATRKAAKKSEHVPSEAKVVTPPPKVKQPKVETTKPEAVTPPVKVKVEKPKVQAKAAPVIKPKVSLEKQVSLDDHHRSDQFVGLLRSAGTEKAMLFLRDCFGVVSDPTCKRTMDEEHNEALMMEYIKQHVDTFRSAVHSMDDRPYGRVDPHGKTPRFVQYLSRRTENMWQHHDGPVVTEWDGKPYTVTEPAEMWCGRLNEETGEVEAHFLGHGHRRYVKRIHIGYLQWLEGNTGMEKMVCELGVDREEGPLRGSDWIFHIFSRHYPVMIGDLRIGLEKSTISCWIPVKNKEDEEARKGREVRSKISIITVAGRLAEPMVRKDPVTVADNVLSIAEFTERQAASSAKHLVEVDAQLFDGLAANDVPDDTVVESKNLLGDPTVYYQSPVDARHQDKEEPDATVVAPAHFQATKHRTEPLVDRNHQRMLAFRDSALTRLLPRYVIDNTETAPVTMQHVLKDQSAMAYNPGNSNVLTLMGDFVANVAAKTVVARFRLPSPRQLAWQDEQAKARFDRRVDLAKWRNGRESRAAWELDKRNQARYMDRRLGESWLSSPKRVGLPLHDVRICKADRITRLDDVRWANLPEYSSRDMQAIHERDDYTYDTWAFAQDKPLTDLQAWFERAAWKDEQHEMTTLDFAYACVKSTVAGHRVVFDTFAVKASTSSEVESPIITNIEVIIPEAGLELSGQGKALVVDVAGNELVADNQPIVSKPDTIDLVKEDIVFSQIMAAVPGAMTEVKAALIEAIDTGASVSEVRRIASQYTTETPGGILVA